jgi:hypothetical protein
MPVECVHPPERLPATFTFMGSIIEMNYLVALAVVSPLEPFPTPRPLALEWFLFVM